MDTVAKVKISQEYGKTKLTAVTISSNGRKKQFFVRLRQKATGGAELPQHMLNKMLDSMNIQRGQTYTVG